MSSSPEQLRELAMSQRRTPEAFMESAKNAHGDKYTYPDLSDVRARSKIRVVCPIHGEFIQTVNNHVNGRGCTKCGIASIDHSKVAKHIRPSNRTSNTVWLTRFNDAHGDRYQYPDFTDPNYSCTDRTNIRVVCPIHGVSYQLPRNHIRGCGCNKCGIQNTALQKPTNTRTTEEFINEALELHGSQYRYPDLSDVRSDTRIRIICQLHGEFVQTIDNHLKGRGCIFCANSENAMVNKVSPEVIMERLVKSQGERYDWYEYPPDLTDRLINERITVYCKRHKSSFTPTLGALIDGSGCPKCALGIEPLNIDPRDVRPGRRTIGKLTWDVFLKRATAIHGTKYRYAEPDQSEWNGMKTVLTIKCLSHGEFRQIADIHIGQGSGCPRCKASKGERLIGSMLEKASIQYDFQKTFPDLMGDGNRPLRLDFYIPSLKVIIEYDGEHHYKPVNFGTVSDAKADTNHATMKRSDMQKEKYAEANGMVIVRIAHNEPVESIADKLEPLGVVFPIDSGIRIPPPRPY